MHKIFGVPRQKNKEYWVILYEIHNERLLISPCLDRCNERYSCNAWNYTVFLPKMLFRYQFRCRHAHENVPFACMNPVLMKRSTRIVNWHSNILNDQPTDNSRYLQFLHNILCTSWYFLNEFCNIILTVEKFEIVYNFTL